MSDKTIDLIEREYLANLECEKANKERKERERAERNEKLSAMSAAEYIAERSGKPKPLPTKDLAALSMKDYIKARKG